MVSLNWIRVSETRWRSDAAPENVGCAMGSESAGRERSFVFDRFTALATLRRIGEGKLRVGDRQEDGSHAQPQGAVRQQNSLQRDELRCCAGMGVQ